MMLTPRVQLSHKVDVEICELICEFVLNRVWNRPKKYLKLGGMEYCGMMYHAIVIDSQEGLQNLPPREGLFPGMNSVKKYPNRG